MFQSFICIWQFIDIMAIVCDHLSFKWLWKFNRSLFSFFCISVGVSKNVDLIKWNHLFFFFSSIDATNSSRLGKYVNDSNKANSNAKMRQIEVDGFPRLCLFALKDIKAGTELRYDYEATGVWWRKTMVSLFLCCFMYNYEMFCW